jgi:FixJ family two-component response regulator
MCGHGLSLVNSTGWTAETDVLLYSAAHADPAHDHEQRKKGCVQFLKKSTMRKKILRHIKLAIHA